MLIWILSMSTIIICWNLMPPRLPRVFLCWFTRSHSSDESQACTQVGLEKSHLEFLARKREFARVFRHFASKGEQQEVSKWMKHGQSTIRSTQINLWLKLICLFRCTLLHMLPVSCAFLTTRWSSSVKWTLRRDCDYSNNRDLSRNTWRPRGLHSCIASWWAAWLCLS